MKILFATSNRNKAKEISSLLDSNFEILTLEDLNLTEEIPETALDLVGNAILKANYITKNFNIDCFADDTGLEINTLNGEPGVLSARYAGENRDDHNNMDLVLSKLRDEQDRTARFKTVITLNFRGQQHIFEGIVEGEITKIKMGTNGFGYDPIFKPNGAYKTFGQMNMEEKNAFSHRSRAFNKMITFLAKHSQ